MNRSLALARAMTVVAALALAPAARAADEPLALLVKLTGRVQVTPVSATKPQPAQFGRPLMRGERLHVPAGGSATVFFNDGNVIELGEKSTIVISGRAAPRGTSGSAMPAEVFKTVAKNLVAGSRETGLVALAPLRGGAEAAPLLESPRRTQVLADRPAFAWRAVDGATRYRLAVSDDRGELWRREVTGTTLDYPADAEPLVRGAEVLWEVEALSDTDALRKEESSFTVASADEADLIRTQAGRIREATGAASTDVALYLEGVYLAGHGVYGEAAERLRELCALTPEAAPAHEALGQAYRSMGLNDRAREELEKAKALAPKK